MIKEIVRENADIFEIVQNNCDDHSKELISGIRGEISTINNSIDKITSLLEEFLHANPNEDWSSDKFSKFVNRLLDGISISDQQIIFKNVVLHVLCIENTDHIDTGDIRKRIRHYTDPSNPYDNPYEFPNMVITLRQQDVMHFVYFRKWLRLFTLNNLL